MLELTTPFFSLQNVSEFSPRLVGGCLPLFDSHDEVNMIAIGDRIEKHAFRSIRLGVRIMVFDWFGSNRCCRHVPVFGCLEKKRETPLNRYWREIRHILSEARNISLQNFRRKSSCERAASCFSTDSKSHSIRSGLNSTCARNRHFFRFQTSAINRIRNIYIYITYSARRVFITSTDYFNRRHIADVRRCQRSFFLRKLLQTLFMVV